VEEYYVLATPQDDVFGIHQFVKLDDGTYADSLGVWSEEKLMSYWTGIEEDVKLNVFDDGQPVPPRDPKAKVHNRKLFDTISSVIESHYAR
jgi:hypothetical protein